MSTRAYRVEVPAQLADDPTWNITRDNEISDFLCADEYENELPVRVERLQDLLESDIEISTYTRQQFEKDIAAATADGEDTIYYQLF